MVTLEIWYYDNGSNKTKEIIHKDYDNPIPRKDDRILIKRKARKVLDITHHIEEQKITITLS